jgi:hypothetical protein
MALRRTSTRSGEQAMRFEVPLPEDMTALLEWFACA